jgi:hypothetical protein
MKGLAATELVPVETFDAAAAMAFYDSRSRDLARVAAASPDRDLRLQMTRRILGNVRDCLVADLSEESEAYLDAAIDALAKV